MLNFLKKIFNKEKETEQETGNKPEEKAAIFYALDGETERKIGNFQKAVDNMDKAIELEPDNDMYYVTRALAYKSLGNKQYALRDIEKALELNNLVESTHRIKEEIENL